MSVGRQRILIVEDEANLAEPIRMGLCEEGYQAEIAPTGQCAMRRLSEHWDLVILDLMLPDMAGEAILNNLRQLPDYPPVLVLTARSSLDDKLLLFRQGCDDYLTKPFIFEEFVERVHALSRRSQRVVAENTQYGDLKLNPSTHRVECSAGSMVLSPKEASILRFFMSAPEKIVSRRELLHHVWGLKEEPETNFISVHLFNLRKKLNEIGRGSWLQTIRNTGFILSRESVS